LLLFSCGVFLCFCVPRFLPPSPTRPPPPLKASRAPYSDLTAEIAARRGARTVCIHLSICVCPYFLLSVYLFSCLKVSRDPYSDLTAELKATVCIHLSIYMCIFLTTRLPVPPPPLEGQSRPLLGSNGGIRGARRGGRTAYIHLSIYVCLSIFLTICLPASLCEGQPRPFLGSNGGNRGARRGARTLYTHLSIYVCRLAVSLPICLIICLPAPPLEGQLRPLLLTIYLSTCPSARD